MQVSIKMAAIPDVISGAGGPSVTGINTPVPSTTKSKRNRKKKKASNSHTLGYKPSIRGEATVDASFTEELPTKTHSNTAKMAETVERLGYSRTEVSTALDRLKEADEEVTFSSLIDMSCAMQQEFLNNEITKSHYNSGKETQQPTHDHPDADLSEEDCDTGGEDDDENIHTRNFQEDLQRAIENRKMELRAAIESLTFQCKVCRCSRATILLLPCGHLASCDDCLMDVRRCPISRCNKVVRGTKEVYFA